MLSGALKRMFGPSVRPQKPYTFSFGLSCIHRSPKPFVTAVCAFTETLCHKYTTLFRISIIFYDFFRHGRHIEGKIRSILFLIPYYIIERGGDGTNFLLRGIKF